MYQNRQNRLVAVIFFIIVVSAFFWLMMRTKTGGSTASSSSATSKTSSGGKMEVSYEALEKAWKEAKKMERMSALAKGPVPPAKAPATNMPASNMPPTNQPFTPSKMPPYMQKMAANYTKEIGNRDAKVRVDAFLPMESCQGPTTMTLEKLAKEYKDKLYVRTYPLFGTAPGQVGVHCATIFINGKNYIKVDNQEIVFGSTTTHNVKMIEKAIRQAIAEAYGTSTGGAGGKGEVQKNR